MEYAYIGRTNVKISRIGIGTWQWGEKLWRYGVEFDLASLKKAFDIAVDIGINFFDTAEIYGAGKSEIILGKFIAGDRERFVIATKVWPTRMSRNSIRRALEASLSRLKTDYVDLYYVHWPNPLASMRIIAKTFVELLEENKIRAIGVSNFNLKQMVRFDGLVNKKLSANQVRYSLLHREVEQGLLQYCKKNNITLVAYSPLDQGALTGKYNENNLPKDLARSINIVFTRINMRRIKPLREAIAELARQYGVKPVNIILRYIIDMGAIPIVGIRKPSHVYDLARTFEFKLKHTDIKYLRLIASKIRLSRMLAGLEVAKRVIQNIVSVQ